MRHKTPEFQQGHDRLLVDMTAESFYGVVKNTLERFRGARYEDHLRLLSTELANTELITQMLPPETDHIELRWEAICFLLRWSIAALKPTSPSASSADEEQWFAFKTLYHLYELGDTMDGTASRLSVSTPKLRSLRDDAIRRVAHNLRMALTNQIGLSFLQSGFTETLYLNATAMERAIMEFMTVWHRPIEREELAKQIEDDESATIRRMITRGLIVLDEDSWRLSLWTRLRGTVITMLSPSDKRHWSRTAAGLALQRRDWIHAVHLWIDANEPERAAALLVAEHESIVDRGEIEGLYTAAQSLIDYAVDEDYASMLQITAGQAAMRIADVKTALSWYRKAIGAYDLGLRVYALFLSGKATQTIAVAESQRYYVRGIELLAEYSDPCLALKSIRHDLDRTALLFDLLLGLAWLYIQEMPDLVLAKSYLQEASGNLPLEDKRRETELHNGWAGFFKEVGNEPQVLHHRYLAWVAAQESGSTDLQLMTVHNLGQACIWNDQFREGARYIQLAIELAIQIGDRQREGKCRQTMGVAFFFEGRYEEAVHYYAEALELFRKTGNRNWMSWAHHDLTEAYVQLGNYPKARIHMLEAQAFASELGSAQLTSALAKLYRDHPGLNLELTESEAAIIGYVRCHKAITTRACVDALGMKSRTASRTLNRLVEIGLLSQIGKGRSTAYLLA